MARRPDDPFARLAAYALLGAVIGGATVWFVADSFSMATLGSGLAGGAVWKFWSVTGGDHHDHEALQRTENAKELERCATIIILFFLAGILAHPTFFPPSFRSLVRRATGAYAYQKKYNQAFKLGAQRRAYLKGVGLARGCPPPARPNPVEAEPEKTLFKGDTPD